MFEFEKWWSDTQETAKNLPFECTGKAAWNESRRQTAEEIIQFIMDQGLIECGKDDVYFVMQDDLEELREKFGLEI